MNKEDDRSQYDLTGQVALVTGGGRGLGRSFAEALSEVGASVAVIARSTDQLNETVSHITQMGGRAIAISLDVTDRQAVERMADEINSKLGPVDLLVNNAGIMMPAGPIWEIDADEWGQALDINVRGPFLCARAILPQMLAQRSGRIINIVSIGGLRGIPYMSAYVTSKAALIRLTESLAAETKEYGISVFAVHPGDVRTAMTEYMMESDEWNKWRPTWRPRFESRAIPIEVPTNSILRIASGVADHLTGCYIDVTDQNQFAVDGQEIEQGDLYTLRLRLPSDS